MTALYLRPYFNPFSYKLRPLRTCFVKTCFVKGLLILFPITSSFSSSLEHASSLPPEGTHSLNENPDVEAQIKGDYPDLDRKESLPLGAIQHAWDRASPKEGIYQVVYHPQEVIRIRCREMMATTIIFPAWERIDKVLVGDPESFKTQTPKAHILTIHPQEFIGVDTNITAFGASGKVYTFYARSEGYNTKHISDLSIYVRVPKPSNIPYTPSTIQTLSLDSPGTGKNDYLEEGTFDPADISFDFDMAGDPEIAPQRVYSDGIRTWFDYGDSIAKKTLPAIYAQVDGVDTPVNVSRKGNKLVAQAAGSFTLLSGQKSVCVTPSKKSPS